MDVISGRNIRHDEVQRNFPRIFNENKYEHMARKQILIITKSNEWTCVSPGVVFPDDALES